MAEATFPHPPGQPTDQPPRHGSVSTRAHGRFPPVERQGNNASRATIAAATPESIGVDELSNCRQIAPQLLVLLALAVDLLACVQDRRMVASAELLADAQKGHVGL